jgi:serine O-acetyltransferase
MGSLPKITEELNAELEKIFEEYSLFPFIQEFVPIKLKVTQLVFEDLEAFRERDPATKIYAEAWHSLAFKAVRYYRYANCIYTQVSDDEIERDYKLQIIREISEKAKKETNVEIHPRATIGSRLYVDHGTHTVIGEACLIGNDCMILNNVVLGSTVNPDTPPEDRHPKIGNNVKIYSDVKVLGNINIGDNCRIGTRCIIMRSLPPNSKVSIVNQLMIQSGSEIPKVYIYGVVPIPPRTLKVIGDSFLILNNIRIDIVDLDFSPIRGVSTNNYHITNDRISFDINGEFDIKNSYINIHSDNSDLAITECFAAISKLTLKKELDNHGE